MNREKVLAFGGIVAGLAFYMRHRNHQRVREHSGLTASLLLGTLHASLVCEENGLGCVSLKIFL